MVGVVMEKQGSGANVRTDAGEVYALVFAPETKFQKVAPGETTLKGALNSSLSELTSGDRVLARGTETDAKTIVAMSLVIMSKTDLANKEQKERADWQRRGITGTVTAVDAAKKEIAIRLPSLATQQTVAVALKDGAPLRRYAQDSVRFADAKPASVNDVKPGDQLRARGDRNADGSRFNADEVVTGTFQTLAATVSSVNAEANEILIKDLDSNQILTIKLTADSTLKRLPEFGGVGRPGMPGGPGGAGGRVPAAPGASGPGVPAAGGAPPARMPDIQQMLERLPPSTLADLKPGEAILVASTKGAAVDRLTAITVLAGAERLIAMRRAMAARPGGNTAGQSATGGSWNLGDMSMMPMP